MEAMGKRDLEALAIQDAFWAEFRQKQDLSTENETPLLQFLVETLEADTAGVRRRFVEGLLAMGGLVFLLIQFRDTPYETWAFLLIPLALTYALQRVASPKRPAVIEAATETLLSPTLYPPEQLALIARIAAATLQSEQKLRTTCQSALTRRA